MSATRSKFSSLASEVELVAAVESWAPRGQARPAVALERRAEGLRVKLTYLGVDSGAVFAWGASSTPESVRATLDRMFDVLSWRVTSPPRGG